MEYYIYIQKLQTENECTKRLKKLRKKALFEKSNMIYRAVKVTEEIIINKQETILDL
jgi:hypothetical protein